MKEFITITTSSFLFYIILIAIEETQLRPGSGVRELIGRICIAFSFSLLTSVLAKLIFKNNNAHVNIPPPPIPTPKIIQKEEIVETDPPPSAGIKISPSRLYEISLIPAQPKKQDADFFGFMELVDGKFIVQFGVRNPSDMGRKLYIAGAFSSLQNIESVTEGQAISNWQKVKGESGANLFETIVVLSEKISLIKYKIMKGGFGLWKKGNEIARLHNSDDFELANPEKDDLILFLSEKILEVLKISEASLSLELEKEVFIHPEKLKSSKDFAIATARCIEKLSKEKNIQEPFRFLSLLAIKKK